MGSYIEEQMATIDVTDAEFEEKVINNPMPVFVDFWAPWCVPCKTAGPVLEELSEAYKDKMIIAKLNVDKNPQTSSKYDVMSIPTTIIFKGGQEIGRQTGFSGKQTFEELLKKAL